MAIPNFQAVFLPLLKDLALGERTSQDTVSALAKEFHLTDEDLAVRLANGKHSKFANRIAWAKAHLKAAGLAESPRRGVYRLTQLCRDTLAQRPERLDIKYLEQFPSYNAFRYGEPGDGKHIPKDERDEPEGAETGTPDEVMEAVSSNIDRR
jgi:restriction system protein